ncbi:hypothetical protein [Pacificispira sp.]|uniref:hypothetical protein n=1 Tax=Pacificispira sp. TaxID=2888761 RepID=UPI003B521FC6
MDVMYRSGHYHRRYSQRETDRLFRPTLHGIFVPEDDPNSFVKRDPGPDLFQNRDWKIFAGLADPWGGCVTNPPLGENDPRNDHFLNPESMEWEMLRPLFHALVEQEIDEIIHMGGQLPEPETDNPDSLDDSFFGAVTSPPLQDATFFAYSQHPAFVIGEAYMFSRNGRWGIYGSTDGFFVCGGEPGLIDRVFQLAGGEDCLKELFYRRFRTSNSNELWRSMLPKTSIMLGMCKLSGWDPLPEMYDP